MLKKKILVTFAVVMIALTVYWNYPKHSSTIVFRDPLTCGMVSTEETACSIAEAVWLQTYGDIIYHSTPFVATLKDSVWIVKGTLHAERGGTPYMELSKKDGRILKVVHYK
ncbi:MAG TPA: YbbC/YhhH family protein [Chryseolinea sp.]|nr:YbbC/YhhH family protein [Chryseolinea sp.]